jgi:hypothetical protein
MTASVKKIRLNFGAISTQKLSAISSWTLQAGGCVETLPAEPQVGDKMPDGSLYAGISPDTNKPMYAMPADAPLTMTFNEAQDYAAELDAHGHHDWRVPTNAELNLMFNNRAAIGGINAASTDPAGWYWSSSSLTQWGAWGQRFSSDGSQYHYPKGDHSCLRCVR